MNHEDYYFDALQTVCCQGIEDAYFDQAIEDQLRSMTGMSSDDAWEPLPEVHFYHSPYRPAH